MTDLVEKSRKLKVAAQEIKNKQNIRARHAGRQANNQSGSATASLIEVSSQETKQQHWRAAVDAMRATLQATIAKLQK